ncbi:hypothetical protein JJB09_03275 [Rhizobium sp. KVB221]|uniref:Rap1a immunity protein domain-containing protein n=1 Tax=Rhizobium setariae TaxID=2801340 RepID=A0A936YIR9_9HYPH|nr:Rap1a/Tai family immunity protein [Rhizobium setariae]MBL0371039.1 hypothetical protein [Rhizobium setariae]
MLRRGLAAVVLALSFWQPAVADFYTGKDIKKFCETKSPIFLGYLAGWTDKWERDTNAQARGYEQEKTPQGKRAILAQLQQTTEGICIPYGANLGQMQEILCKYIDAHPDKLSTGSTELIAQSLSDAWQCESEE